MRSFIFTAVALIFVVCGGQKQPAPKAVQQPAKSETTTLVSPESLPPPSVIASGAKQSPQKDSSVALEMKEAQPAQLPKLWDFFATWCPPCKEQAPIIEELAAEYKGQIEIISIDTDKNQELARKFNIQAIPTLVFLDPSGKELSRRVGFFPKDSIVARFKAHGFIK